MPASRLTALSMLLLLVLACRRGGDAPEGAGGRLEARWTGADTGALRAPARAGWCAEAARLELAAIREDEGMGLALYPLDSLGPGTYPAFDPGVDTTPRPGVAAAARWYTDPAIVGYQSDSGSLTLTRAGAALTGEFGFRLTDLTREDTIRLTGRFQDVVPGPCRVDSLPNPGPGE